MDLSFGARLRLHREQQHVALTTIAELTKIKRSLLEGLERDDVSQWPKGIFRRANIREYAQAIGLEPDPVLREFLALYPDPDEESQADLATASGTAVESVGRPPMRLGFLIGSAVDAVSDLLQRGGRRDAGPEPTVLRREPEVSATTQADVPAPTRDASVEANAPALKPDLSAVACLCTKLGRVQDTHELTPLLEETARILDAVGLIVWVWDDGELRPALAHGYSAALLAQLPNIRRDADNPIAKAFRSAETSIVDRGAMATGAVVVPLVTPRGSVGTLALELRNGGEQQESVRAVATILAAQLSTLIEPAPLAKPVRRVRANSSPDRLRRLASARIGGSR